MLSIMMPQINSCVNVFGEEQESEQSFFRGLCDLNSYDRHKHFVCTMMKIYNSDGESEEWLRVEVNFSSTRGILFRFIIDRGPVDDSLSHRREKHIKASSETTKKKLTIIF